MKLTRLTNEEIFDIIKAHSDVYIVYRPVGGIGDAVMIMAAITGVRNKIGKSALLIVMCVEYIRSVFEHNPAIDYIMSYTEPDIGEKKDIVDVAKIKELGCTLYPLHHPCPAAVYEADACPQIYKTRQEIFSEACDVKFSMYNYNFILHEEELDIPKTMMLPDRYVVVQLRSHDRWRDYRFTRWLLMELKRLGKKMDFGVVTVDAEMDAGIKGVISLYKIPLNYLFGVVNSASLIIGPDSSFIHIGGALERNVLGMFGPTNPAVRMRYKYPYWLSRFGRCTKQYCWYDPCRWRFCMSFKPKVILEKTKMILQEAV